MTKTIFEPASQIPVFDEADILVVGGGPAGTAAAISAARNGARVILSERYGYLGGQVTGGHVSMIPNIDNGTGVQITGILQEWMDRLGKLPDGLYGPSKKDAGSSDPELIKQWSGYMGTVWNNKICYGTYVDPELLKIVLNDMVEESNVIVYFHCWAAKAYMEDGQLKGVFFESKEGRKAVLAKVIIDATGEGDIFASAGAEFDDSIDPAIRNSNLSLCFRIANIDHKKYLNYIKDNRQDWAEKMNQILKMAGFRMALIPSNRNDNVWVNNWTFGKNGMKVKDLTFVEIEVRKQIVKVIEFLNKEMPGYENGYLMDVAPQIGVRYSRRLKGLYQISFDDLKQGKTYDDVVAITPAQHVFNAPGEEIPMQIPYRALVPEKLDNLIAAGRCLSADVYAHNWINLIPPCTAIGEAAGAAAYVAVNSNIQPRNADVKTVQNILKKQGFYLP
ncbi:putative thiazole biosynthetic enzyme [Oxobacter pfennigii]|uniref:Putative thiazole biosynthetic enzyme n=1 Tax=Oxobacter pfennigii TaxID=36849 RepID=A0A0P8Y848_9CLOT|nr:FAD-dependent oxidoreductase [Oxobacter pfennigii]KPU42822.1 putative thiazole biosynthetic enzyme [Oxobacter pfennigii]